MQKRKIRLTALIMICSLLSCCTLAMAEDNAPPVVIDFDHSAVVNTPETIRLTAEDANADLLTFAIVTPPQNGTLELVDPVLGLVIYTCTKSGAGTDYFVFKANDGHADSNTAVCNITITDEGLQNPDSDADNTDNASSADNESSPITFVYEDMKRHWANYSASHLVEKNVLKGEKIGRKYYFYPDAKMTRNDFINLVLSALEFDTDSVDISLSNSFADLDGALDCIKTPAAAALDLGLIDGDASNGKLYYNADEPITRIEAIAIISRAITPNVISDGDLTYADAQSVPDWGVQHVLNMENYGIIKGYDDNTIRPNAVMTKAQSAEMVYQMIKYREANPRSMIIRMHDAMNRIEVSFED